MTTPRRGQVKSFLGQLIKKITITFYKLIKLETARIGLYTHEIRYNSKAFKIFTEQEFDFKNERLMQREVLLFLLQNFPKDQTSKFINTLTPLSFGQFHTNHYVESILNIHKDTSVKDEMLYLYEEGRPSKDRFQKILVIGSNINFDYFEDNDKDSCEEKDLET